MVTFSQHSPQTKIGFFYQKTYLTAEQRKAVLEGHFLKRLESPNRDRYFRLDLDPSTSGWHFLDSAVHLVNSTSHN